MSILRIYTDGACSGNQNEENIGGWGAIGPSMGDDLGVVWASWLGAADWFGAARFLGAALGGARGGLGAGCGGAGGFGGVFTTAGGKA